MIHNILYATFLFGIGLGAILLPVVVIDAAINFWRNLPQPPRGKYIKKGSW
jgi:hypothetical protein